MDKRKRALTASVLVVLLAACSSHTTRPAPERSHEGESSYHALADDHMAHYHLALGSTSTGATLIDHPAPIYPAAMLARCPAEIRFQALLIVGADGKVGEVRIAPSAAIPPAFAAAVRTAVLGWRFEPLLISRWAADANDRTHTVDTQAKPFSLPYEFGFACRAGKAEVSSTPTPAD